MASFVYAPAKTGIARATIDLDANDIRVLLVKVAASTTTDTEQDAATISAFTTLGELVATNYVRKALTGEVVNEDLTNDRAEFDAADVTWTALGGAANDTIGAAIIFKFITDDTDSIPIAYIDLTDTTTNGGDITLSWNVEGILQLT